MDLNGDGYNDILSGSYSRMSQPMAGLFQVLWGTEGNEFQKAEVLTGTDGEPLIIPVDNPDMIVENICTRPTACDWDGDGDLDLVVGNFAGGFYVFSGEGEGAFDPVPTALLTDGNPLKIDGVHSDPFIVDWDGDGDLDLMSGSSNGGVYLAENTAGEGEMPSLSSFTTVIEPNSKFTYGQMLDESQLDGPTTSTRIYVDDVNEDGKLDILVGDNTTLVSPADGMTEEEFNRRQLAWDQKMQELSQAMSELSQSGDAEKLNEVNQEYIAHYNERSSFIIEERTGFVWLYLQK